MSPEKIEGTDEAWETRALGASGAHAVVAGVEYENALNAALGLPSRPLASTESLDGSTSAEWDGLSVDIEKAALDNPELPLQFVRDIIVSLEEMKSGEVPTAYEPGGGH